MVVPFLFLLLWVRLTDISWVICVSFSEKGFFTIFVHLKKIFLQLKIMYLLLYFIWDHANDMWDLSSPTRNPSCTPSSGIKVLTAGPVHFSIGLFVFFLLFCGRASSKTFTQYTVQIFVIYLSTLFIIFYNSVIFYFYVNYPSFMASRFYVILRKSFPTLRL